MIYLSVPYTSPDAATRVTRARCAKEQLARLMSEGVVTVCPVAMNHDAISALPGASSPDGSYWRELEERLADACDELVVLCLPGWEDSRGVAREIALFEARLKPVRLMRGAGAETASSNSAASLPQRAAR